MLDVVYTKMDLLLYTTIDLRPLAPVFCSMALSATAYNASGEKSNTTWDSQTYTSIVKHTLCVYNI